MRALADADINLLENDADGFVAAIEAGMKNVFDYGPRISYEISVDEVLEWFDSDSKEPFTEWMQEKAYEESLLDIGALLASDISYALLQNKEAFEEWPKLLFKLKRRVREFASALIEHDEEGKFAPSFDFEYPALRCNLLAGTPTDANTYFIGTTELGDMITGDRTEAPDKDFEDSAVNWLIKQQGCTV